MNDLKSNSDVCLEVKGKLIVMANSSYTCSCKDGSRPTEGAESLGHIAVANK